MARKNTHTKLKKTPAKASKKRGIEALKERRKQFLARRTHRSFRLTKRRDYIRSSKLPGYISFTNLVFKTLRKNWRILTCIALIYMALMTMVSSIISQEMYDSIRTTVHSAQEDGDLSSVLSVLFITSGVASAQLSGGGASDSNQQVAAIIFGLFAWLATIWALRAILAGGKPKARDAVYSSGGPIVALIVLSIVGLIQALPAIFAVIVYNTANTSGMLDQTFVLMLFGGGAVLLVTLSAYWITSTLFAMVIVGLPGTYPLKAVRLAGDIVLGRRIRILLRLVWMLFIIAITWLVVLIPIVLLDGALRSAIPAINWLPIVPVFSIILSAASVVFSASYVYLLYRKVVSDETTSS